MTIEWTFAVAAFCIVLYFGIIKPLIAKSQMTEAETDRIEEEKLLKKRLGGKKILVIVRDLEKQHAPHIEGILKVRLGSYGANIVQSIEDADMLFELTADAVPVGSGATQRISHSIRGYLYTADRKHVFCRLDFAGATTIVATTEACMKAIALSSAKNWT